jgi:hypothetical protein
VFLLAETDGVAEHRRIEFGISPAFVSSFFTHITLDLADWRHKPPLWVTDTAGLRGFPTSEGKPAPCKGKAFSRLLKMF